MTPLGRKVRPNAHNQSEPPPCKMDNVWIGNIFQLYSCPIITMVFYLYVLTFTCIYRLTYGTYGLATFHGCGNVSAMLIKVFKICINPHIGC
jgi:hypothetical protein